MFVLQDLVSFPVLEPVPGGERGPFSAGIRGVLHVLPDLPHLWQHLRRLPHARITGTVGEGIICYPLFLKYLPS